jgi:hypothetical protein
MYAVVRRYPGTSQLFEELTRRRAGVEQIIRGVPGFVDDSFVGGSLIRPADGGVSVTVCEDRAGTEESTRRAAGWVRQSLPAAAGSPPEPAAGGEPYHLGRSPHGSRCHRRPASRSGGRGARRLGGGGGSPSAAPPPGGAGARAGGGAGPRPAEPLGEAQGLVPRGEAPPPPAVGEEHPPDAPRGPLQRVLVDRHRVPTPAPARARPRRPGRPAENSSAGGVGRRVRPGRGPVAGRGGRPVLRATGARTRSWCARSPARTGRCRAAGRRCASTGGVFAPPGRRGGRLRPRPAGGLRPDRLPRGGPRGAPRPVAAWSRRLPHASRTPIEPASGGQDLALVDDDGDVARPPGRSRGPTRGGSPRRAGTGPAGAATSRPAGRPAAGRSRAP